MGVNQNDIMLRLIQDRSKLFAYVWTIVRDDHLAEDVFQEICILILQQKESFVSELQFNDWVRRVARYKSLSVLKKHRPNQLKFDTDAMEMLDQAWSGFDAFESVDMLDSLRHCLGLLSPYARKIITLRYVQGLSGQRLADALGRKLNTVYVALTRVHGHLAKCMRNQLHLVD